MSMLRPTMILMVPCLFAACDSATLGNERGESTLVDADLLGPWEGFDPAYFGVTTASFGYDETLEAAVPVVYVDDDGVGRGAAHYPHGAHSRPRGRRVG